MSMKNKIKEATNKMNIRLIRKAFFDVINRSSCVKQNLKFLAEKWRWSSINLTYWIWFLSRLTFSKFMWTKFVFNFCYFRSIQSIKFQKPTKPIIFIVFPQNAKHLTSLLLHTFLLSQNVSATSINSK